MINPSGLSVKFDELTSANFTYVPSNDYNYTADLLPAQAVRVLVPIYAGAEKVNWNVSCGVVALDLVDFSVKKETNNALIAWKTANEVAVSHFEIEKSNDGKTFATIAEVKARNTTSANDYTFTDKTPLSIIQYFRLKMVDLDGKITFSKVVSLSNDGVKNHLLKIYPSVAHDFLTIEIGCTDKACLVSTDDATLTFVDLLGRVVWSKNICGRDKACLVSADGISIHKLSISDFPNGLYSVILRDRNGQLVGKFVKQ
jgi:hypothetical protein